MLQSRSIVLFLLLFKMIFYAQTQSIHLNITNIRSDKGQICVGVFTNSESFEQEEPCIEKCYSKKNFADGKYEIVLDLKPGIYGVSILDDENMNGKMNYNFLGVPTEGFGFGGYKHKGLKKPVFSDFSFCVQPNEIIRFDVVLRYFELSFKK